MGLEMLLMAQMRIYQRPILIESMKDITKVILQVLCFHIACLASPRTINALVDAYS